MASACSARAAGCWAEAELKPRTVQTEARAKAVFMAGNPRIELQSSGEMGAVSPEGYPARRGESITRRAVPRRLPFQRVIRLSGGKRTGKSANRPRVLRRGRKCRLGRLLGISRRR